MEDFNYLLYVRKYSILTNDYELYVYKTKSKDILHTMGEIKFRTLEEVKRIDIKKYDKETEQWWKDKGYQINIWYDKYEIGRDF